MFSMLVLVQIFPRHVLEFLCVSSLDKVPGNISKLARRHDDVTILFMDIVGESLTCSGLGNPCCVIVVLLSCAISPMSFGTIVADSSIKQFLDLGI